MHSLYYTHVLVGWVTSVVYSTHSTVFNSIWFVLISRLRANNGLLLVIVFTGLLSPSIHLTLAILRLLYN
jgi:hypothetical protein